MTTGRAVVIVALLVMVVGTSIATIRSPGAATQETLVVIAGTLIDGTGSEPEIGRAIVIEEGRIAAIHPATTFDPPADATVIDASGLTVLPGFVNAHTHFTKDFAERRDNHLTHGATAICNLGAGINQMPEFDVYRNDAGELAARGFKAGPFVAKEGGYAEANWGEGANYNIVGAEEARRAVFDLADRGADYIKISFEPGPGDWPILSDEEVRSVVGAAHERGLHVIAHVSDLDYFDNAIDGGVDAITHIPSRVDGPGTSRRTVFSGTPANPEIPERYDEQITRMVEAGVVWIPTIDVMIGQSAGSIRAHAMIDVMRRFRERGGAIAIGNDYPLGVTRPGIPIGEMAHLIEAGFTEMDVIVAGTRNSAAICGQGEDLGTIEEGKLADLVVIEGDPVEDVETLREVRVVILDGELAFDYRVEPASN